MSETEFVDEVTEGIENDDTTVEYTEPEITINDYNAKVLELEKAKKKIAHLSKEAKTHVVTQNPSLSSRDDVRAILAEERFYEKNPEAEPYRVKIDELVSKGLSREDALFLASKDDKEIDANREVYGKGTVPGKGSTESGVTTVSIERYDTMTSSEQESYIKAMTAKHGKVRFK